MIRLALLLALLPIAAAAVTCESGRFESIDYTACTVDPRTENLRLYLRDDSGAVLGSFSALATHVAPARLSFAMNAGMFHDDRAPVGHYRENGQEQMRVITSAGPGNFGLLPNGILCLNDTDALIWETRAFAATRPECRDATQSGPMLVIAGQLHPRFLEHSTSRYIRNGVGQMADGRLAFVISHDPVNFHRFARLFRDRLGTSDALYLDGNISRLYAPDTGHTGFGFTPLGPIIAVTE